MRASWLERMENVIVLLASWLESMENVIVLPGSKQLAAAANEKTVDIHVFITITRSISLISMCLLLSLARYLWYPCVYYYYWSISLIFLCLLLSLVDIWYPCVYYYHWVDIADIHVFITITRSISLIPMCLLLSLGRYLWYPYVYYYH